eukprot:scaffold408719_cov20-Prasinocladus_malaysianus.AAC.1
MDCFGLFMPGTCVQGTDDTEVYDIHGQDSLTKLKGSKRHGTDKYSAISHNAVLWTVFGVPSQSFWRHQVRASDVRFHAAVSVV